MGTISQKSFAARLDRAEKFHQRMLTFSGYDPGEEDLTEDGYRTLVDSIKASHASHQTTQYEFLEEAKKRAKAFATNPDALSRLATQVKSYTRGKFKRDSHQFESIEKLVNKMRGEKPVTVNKGSGEQTISQSETSYGAQLANFEDILSIVTGLGTQYAPANTAIKVPQLVARAQNASLLNRSVSAKYALHMPTIAKRQNGFAELEDRSTRIKDMVKSQYGADSEQYKLIKGLNFTM